MARLSTSPLGRTRWVAVARSLTPPVLWSTLHKVLAVGDIPDKDAYRPHYSPWLEPAFAARVAAIASHTRVPAARCWTLWRTLRQVLNVEGDVLEAGVYRGGTARLLKEAMEGSPGRRLRLFDSFEGMARTSETLDRHRPGDFADTSLAEARAFVGDEPFIDYHQGWIPESFAGLESARYCFAHIDLDLYQSISDCLGYVWPRLSSGGAVVFDDYGFASCPGARRAVDAFFEHRPEQPLALMTGQALVFKL